ncbi:hypothetical protein [Paracoccus aerodenitrificans]|uniref:hypothetical protein n=1 Tax=Paracoccus aerodenitrificans TaxID=3017781 RepID=UPI0022F08F01|nr:hypothetical protein [Paracoccus aerodenitrificans]WBU62708.1 hypothetical protein PAE61_09990 [Paracoccus aerodenitrificans]
MMTDILLGQTGMAATNNLMPLPFAILGLGLFAIALTEERLNFVLLFLSGVMLAIGPGFKVSAFAFIPAVAIGCFLVPRNLPFALRLRHMVLPVGLGGLLGALPLIWLALTRTDLFFAHIGGYHTGPHIAFWRDNAISEPDLALGLAAKIQLSFSVWFAGAAMLSAFIAALGFATVRRAGPDHRPGWTADAAMIVTAATICAALFAFLPTPGFPQYYAPPLAGLTVLTALLYRALPSDSHAAFRGAVSVALVLTLLVGSPRLALGLNALRHPENFTANRVAQGAERLRQAVKDAGLPADGRVATLSPIYPLEAGLEIYPELSAGLFGYRVTPYIGPELAGNYALISPDGLAGLLDTDPPVAVMTGFDPRLDDAFNQYAQSRGYARRDFPAINDRYGEATLWLAPLSVEEGETQ